MCCDLRALHTIKHAVFAPHAQDLFDATRGAEYFTTFHFRSGYFQIRVNPAHTHETAFRTREGLYEWLAMQFGAVNTPITFSHCMNIFLKIIPTNASSYTSMIYAFIRPLWNNTSLILKMFSLVYVPINFIAY